MHTCKFGSNDGYADLRSEQDLVLERRKMKGQELLLCSFVSCVSEKDGEEAEIKNTRRRCVRRTIGHPRRFRD